MIADGCPQDWVDKESNVSHIRFANAHADDGNTPRGIGALLAASEGAEQICFLDADNTLDADHVETCLDTARKNPYCKFVIARRRFVFPDGSPAAVPEEPGHVDTSCFFMLRGTFHLFSHFILQPRQLTPLCDRVFLALLRYNKLSSAMCEKVTVTYTTNYLTHYKFVGKPAPPNARPNCDRADMTKWWSTLSMYEKEVVRRNVGYPIDPLKL